MKPPMVVDDTSPSTHSTNNKIAIVSNILYLSMAGVSDGKFHQAREPEYYALDFPRYVRQQTPEKTIFCKATPADIDGYLAAAAV